MKSNKSLLAFAVAAIVTLTLLTDPFMLWMPEPLAMCVLIVAAALMCLWVGSILGERAADEREAVHRMNSGRFAYLSGIAVLTTALVVQGFTHAIDPWITGALAVMVVSRVGARIYAERYQ